MHRAAHFRLLGKDSHWLEETTSQIYACAEHFQKMTVLCPDATRLQDIDERLWQNASKQFVTFAHASETDANDVKVLLTDSLGAHHRRPALINLGADIPEEYLTMQYLCEIVFSDDDAVANARRKYKMYHQHGFHLEHFQTEKKSSENKQLDTEQTI